MYQVPEYIDKNKIFIVQRSMIDGRLDPHYNKPDYRELYGTLSKIPCNISTLKKESYSIFSGITPKSGGDAYSNEPGSIPFVRSGDFSETNQIDFSTLLYLKPEVHNGVMHSSQLKKNDLLIAIVGATIGKVGIYQYDREANINQAICGVRLKDYINPLYVQAFYQTGIGQKIIDRIKRPVARANLNLEEIGNLPIPVVDGRTQGIIVAKLQEGINLRLQKELEAQRILNSIDTYLLEELGITLPETRTDLESRIFTIKRSQLEGRLDPKRYSISVRQLTDSILQSPYQCFPLQHYVTKLCSGEWGIDGDSETIPEGYVKCLTLRATEIDNQYNLKINSDSAKYRIISKEKYISIKPSVGDIIVEKSGGSVDQPVGRVAIIETDTFNTIPVSFSNFLMKISVNGINQEYLYYFLKTIYNIGVTDSMQSQTNGIRNLIIKEFLGQTIIEPPLSKQGEISNHIYSLRQQAKALQTEGRALLENAKREVEKMIIGE